MRCVKYITFSKDASLLIQQCTTEVFSKISAEPLQRTSSQSLNKRYYKCSKCSKSFASTHSRNSHMMKAHAEGVYDTVGCTQYFFLAVY